MKQNSLCFPTTKAICLFLKETGLRSFLLLGKKKTLIAAFSREAMVMAQQKYQAVALPVVEEAGYAPCTPQ